MEVARFRELMGETCGPEYERELLEGAAIIIAGFSPVTVNTSRGALELFEDLRSDVRRYFSRAEVLTILKYRQVFGEGPANTMRGPLPGPIGREGDAS